LYFSIILSPLAISKKDNMIFDIEILRILKIKIIVVLKTLKKVINPQTFNNILIDEFIEFTREEKVYLELSLVSL